MKVKFKDNVALELIGSGLHVNGFYVGSLPNSNLVESLPTTLEDVELGQIFSVPGYSKRYMKVHSGYLRLFGEYDIVKHSDVFDSQQPVIIED